MTNASCACPLKSSRIRPTFIVPYVEGVEMKRLFSRVGLVTGTMLVQALPVLANAPEGGGPPDYSGITGLYYVIIAGILAYGVYDTFFKKS
jgi:hypothetical protein